MRDIRRDIWMPFYFGDYLKDTLNLTTEQHGAYLLLRGAYWTCPGPLPDDDAVLAWVTKLGRTRWQSRVRSVLAEFFTVSDGLWRDARLDEELAGQRAQPRRRSRPRFGPADRERIFAMTGGHCFWCRVSLNRDGADDNRDLRRFTVDHVKALANGGPHALDNAVPACRHCNSSRGARA